MDESANSLKGYERRLYLQDKVCERLEVGKNESFELGYILFGNLVVLHPMRLSRLEVKETLDRLRERIKDELNAQEIYKSIGGCNGPKTD